MGFLGRQPTEAAVVAARRRMERRRNDRGMGLPWG
jgi:hypothetical protein